MRYFPIISLLIISMIALPSCGNGSDDFPQYNDLTTEDKQEADRIYDSALGYEMRHQYEQAYKLLVQAAELGHIDAQYRLANMYANGKGVKEDTTEAIKWYKRAAKQGNKKALAMIDRLESEPTEMDAGNTNETQNDVANAEKEYLLGVKYYKGDGVEKDQEEAFKWFKKAAEQGDADAQYNLAHMYFDGNPIEKDNDEALKWFKKASIQGHSEATKWYNRINKTLNTKSTQWYIEAAGEGNAEAQYKLAEMYRTGDGFDKDLHKAVEWYRRAADGGHQESITIIRDFDESMAKATQPQSYAERYANEIKSKMMSGGVCDALKQKIDMFATTSYPDNIKVKQIDTIVDSADRAGCIMY